MKRVKALADFSVALPAKGRNFNATLTTIGS